MLDAALQRMQRDIREHQHRAPRVALRGAWVHLQGRGGIRRRSGATAYSANAGLGQPRVRRVRRGPQYPPRGRGESDRNTRQLKLGQKLWITTGHPGGLLARGIFRSAGFHRTADQAGRKAFESWRFKPRGRR